jgi:hypothetical protein
MWEWDVGGGKEMGLAIARHGDSRKPPILAMASCSGRENRDRWVLWYDAGVERSEGHTNIYYRIYVIMRGDESVTLIS